MKVIGNLGKTWEKALETFFIIKDTFASVSILPNFTEWIFQSTSTSLLPFSHTDPLTISYQLFLLLIDQYFVAEIWYFIKKRNENDTNTIIWWKTAKKMPRRYMWKWSGILCCELALLTSDVTYSKLDRYRGNIGNKKLSQEHNL